LGGLLDLTADNLWDKLSGQLCEGAAGRFALDNLGHLLADGSDLGRSGVGGLLDLIWAALGESDSEEAEKVVVSCLDGDIGLDQ